MVPFLLLFQFLQSSDSRLGKRCCRSGPTSHGSHAGTTVPDANDLVPHLGVVLEGANVLDMLADFNFLCCFSKGVGIAGAMFTSDADLLSAFNRDAMTSLFRTSSDVSQATLELDIQLR